MQSLAVYREISGEGEKRGESMKDREKEWERQRQEKNM